MRLSELVISTDAVLVKDGGYEDMNYCTSQLQIPFLSFIEKETYISRMNPNVTCVICKPELVDKLPENVIGVITSEEPKYLFHVIYNEYSKTIKREIFDTEIGEGSSVSQYAHIASKNVKIGRNVIVEPYAVIHENVTIGDNSIIHSNVVIGARSFSFARSVTGDMCGLCDNGEVIIGSFAEIYPFTHIAQGIWKDDITLIKNNVKIDAQCYIAHGVHIGESTLIASNVSIGGNTSIGDRTWVGLNAAIANRITVGSDARVNMGAVVTKDVEDNTSVSGNFAIEHAKFIDFVKNKMNK